MYTVEISAMLINEETPKCEMGIFGNTETTKRIMYPYKACPMVFRENRTEIMGRFSVQKLVKKATNGRRK